MKHVRMTPEGSYLVVGFKDTHVGTQPYLYETKSLDEAHLFNGRVTNSGTFRKMSAEDKERFIAAIPIPAREIRKVVLVHPDEKESDE